VTAIFTRKLLVPLCGYPLFFWPYIIPAKQFGVTIQDCVREVLASNLVVITGRIDYGVFSVVLPGASRKVPALVAYVD